MKTSANEHDDTGERIAGILDEIGELAIERGWRREDVAVALARGAGELALHGSATPIDLDRAVGALIGVVKDSASGQFSRRLDG